MVAEYVPDAGDLIKVDFRGGQVGHEQAGWRPALVLSPRGYNKKTGLAVVVPVTNAIKGYPFEVNLPAGLKIGGTILSDAFGVEQRFSAAFPRGTCFPRV